jgi:peptidoglycan/xylan/chitin deacetylase (PgdA/CDA1 family)
MHETNLKMIKIILVILTLSVVLNMTSGVSILKNTYYWRTQFFEMQWDFLKTKAAFIKYSGGSLYEWAGSSKSTPSANKASSIPILLYHGLIDDPDWKPDEVNISVSDFRDHMFALKKDGWQTITVEDYVAFVRGKRSLPQKSFMLTFDDGRKDSYYKSDPILRTVGYTAVMNVITGRSLGANNEKGTFHLSRIELEKMVGSGRWELESHTRSGHDYEIIDASGKKGHFLSDKLWLNSKNRLESDEEYKKRVTDDLSGAKVDLEKTLGIKVLAFAYPFGDFGQGSQNFSGSRGILSSVVKSIYPISFYQVSASEFPDNYGENLSMTKRINVSSPLNGDGLVEILKNTLEKPLDYADNFSKDNGWLRGWGTFDISRNTMTIASSDTEDSALTFLDGSYRWKDYFSEAKIKMNSGNSFAMSARYQDESNYVTCDYSQNQVALTQRIAGTDKPDVEVQIPTNLNSTREAQVGIKVIGNSASCFLDGKEIVSGQIDGFLDHGGIGFKTWQTDQNKTSLSIRDLKVSQNSL